VFTLQASQFRDGKPSADEEPERVFFRSFDFTKDFGALVLDVKAT
jgi:hypothetical protein